MPLPDYRFADAIAVRTSVALLQAPLDLSLPTPCAGWKLGDLLAHMTAQHIGFAAAASGEGAAPEPWQVRPMGDDPAAQYAAAATQVIDAFAAVASLDTPLTLPEINRATPFPAWQAISFHCIDYVVHGWDVARTLNIPFSLPDDVLTASLPIAERVPDGESRLRPGAGFAPGLPTPTDASTLDKILTLLGRSPSWPN